MASVPAWPPPRNGLQESCRSFSSRGSPAEQESQPVSRRGAAAQFRTMVPEGPLANTNATLGCGVSQPADPRPAHLAAGCQPQPGSHVAVSWWLGSGWGPRGRTTPGLEDASLSGPVFRRM